MQTIASTPYAVGYLGASFKDDADKAGLETAMLENQDGKFLLPTAGHDYRGGRRAHSAHAPR